MTCSAYREILATRYTPLASGALFSSSACLMPNPCGGLRLMSGRMMGQARSVHNGKFVKRLEFMGGVRTHELALLLCTYMWHVYIYRDTPTL